MFWHDFYPRVSAEVPVNNIINFFRYDFIGFVDAFLEEINVDILKG